MRRRGSYSSSSDEMKREKPAVRYITLLDPAQLEQMVSSSTLDPKEREAYIFSLLCLINNQTVPLQRIRTLPIENIQLILSFLGAVGPYEIPRIPKILHWFPVVSGGCAGGCAALTCCSPLAATSFGLCFGGVVFLNGLVRYKEGDYPNAQCIGRGCPRYAHLLIGPENMYDHQENYIQSNEMQRN